VALEQLVRGNLFAKLYEGISGSLDATEIAMCTAFSDAEEANTKLGLYTLLDDNQTLNLFWCEYAVYAAAKGNNYYLPPAALAFVAQMTGIKICLHKPYAGIEPDVIYEPQEGGRTCHLGDSSPVFPLVLDLGDLQSTQHITHKGGAHYERSEQPPVVAEAPAHQDF
jgi:hypothetical protein